MLDYSGFLELVQKRRSTRKFKPDMVPDELIYRILDAARWAPSGANHQPWEFIVIKDRETKDRITAILMDDLRSNQKLESTRDKDLQHPSFSGPMETRGFKVAPVFIFAVGDPRTRQAQVLSAQILPNSYISSMANAFLYMHLAAATLGLGSQWLSSSNKYLPQALIKQELGIPRGYDIYDMFCLGYPDQSPVPRRVRKLEEIVHWNNYDMSKYRSDEEVKKFAREIQLGRYP